MNEAPTGNAADRRILKKVPRSVVSGRNPSSSPPMYPRRRYPDPFYARSPFAVIAAGTGHAEGLTGHALARINTQRY